MAAPPMLMSGAEQQAALEGPLGLAAEACQGYTVLSAADLQRAIRQAQLLDTKITEKAGQLEVEHKMVEAASSLSRLHLEGNKPEKRMSRVFSHGERAKRLSRQAEDEVEVSMQRIRELESSLLELRFARAELELKILHHRSALLAQAVLHNQEVGKFMSEPGFGRRIQGHARTDSNQTVRAGPDGAANVDLRDDVAILSMKVKSAFPGTTFKDPSDISVLGMGVSMLLKERTRLNQLVQDTQTEAAVHKNRAEQLSEKLVGSENSSSSAIDDSAERARLNAELLEARRNLDEEKNRATQLRLRSETQRKELESTVSALEDVTRLAVGYEHERSGLGDIIGRLEAQVHELEKKDLDATAGVRLDASTSTGILCREFRSILHEQQQKHWAEMRQLRETVVHLNRSPQLVAPKAGQNNEVPAKPFKAPEQPPVALQPSNSPAAAAAPHVLGTPLSSSPITPTSPTGSNSLPQRYSRQSPGKSRNARGSYTHYEAQAEPAGPESPVRIPEQAQMRSPLGNNRMSRYRPQNTNQSKANDDYDLL